MISTRTAHRGDFYRSAPKPAVFTLRGRRIARALLPTLAVLTLVAVVGPVALASAGKQADARLDQALQRLVRNEAGPPGAIAIVRRGDRSSVHRAGVRNLRTDERIRVNDRMRIASTAKAFSGAVALALVSRGKLRLDDTIGERLPGLPAAWAAVTLRQLLQHTSGLPDFSSSPGFIAHVVGTPHVPLPPESLLQFVATEPLEFAPGSAYQYSNSDNIAVALMAAAATGGTYEQQLRKRVIRPLGLTRTSLPVGFNIGRPFIHGYDVEPPSPPEDVSTLFSASPAWASGGIVSTPTDLHRFARAYVGGRLFGRGARAEQLSFVKGGSEPPGPGRNAAGLAIFRYRTSCGTVFGHTGNTAGYTQFLAASRSGRRSATVSVSEQITPGARPELFPKLRRTFRLAVCAALSGQRQSP